MRAKCLICGKRFKVKAPPDRIHGMCKHRKSGKVSGHMGNWVPPPEVDPTRQDRIALYAERANAKLPLFEEN